MSQSEQMKDFSTVSGLMLAEVYASHPFRVNLDHAPIMEAMGITAPTDRLPSGRMFKEMFGATLDWLVQEGFLHREGGMWNVTLTTRGFAAMNAVPANLGGRTVAESIEQAKPNAGSEEGRRELYKIGADLFGTVIGQVIKTVLGA